MRFKLFLFTMLSVVLFSSSGWSQQYRFKHYGAKEGFVSRGADAIVQDTSGFLWVSSWMGLFRFDGVTTIAYPFPPAISPAGEAVKIFDLTIDASDRIWLAAQDRVITLAPVTRTSFSMGYFADEKGAKTTAHPNGLIADKKGQLFVTTDAGFFTGNARDSVLRRISLPGLPEDINMIRNCIAAADDGTVYVATGNQIFRKMQSEKSFSLFREITENGLRDISKIYVGKKTLWCGNYDRSVLIGIDRATKEYREYVIQKDHSDQDPCSHIMAICEMNDSIIWTGSYVGYGNERVSGGISIIHLHSGKIERLFSNGSTNPYGFRSAYVENIFKDRQGTLWVSGFDGIDYYHPTYSDITVYSPSSEAAAYNIPASGVSDVDADEEGNIWIATKSNGLAKINREGNVVLQVPVEKTHLDQTGFIFGEIACGRNGKLYISSTLNVYEIDTRLPDAFDRKHKIVKTGLQGGVTHMLVDKNDNLWISTHMDGVYKIKPDGNEEHFSDEGDELHYIPSGSVLELECTGDSVLASVSNAGVFIFREGMPPLDDLSAERLAAKGWVKGKVREVKISPHWILFAMKDKGVQYLQRKTGKLFRMTMADGLLSNSITAIEIDKKENFWIGTTVGLQRYYPETGVLHSYTPNRSLPETGIFNGAHDVNSDGILYFSNFGHLISIDPNRKEEIVPLRLQLLSVLVNGNEKLEGNSIPDLNYDENNLQLTFSSQNFVNPADDHYEYYLEGFSKKWLPVEGGRTIIFTNLPGGEYLLKLRVKNVSSSQAELTIPFFIKTAFYNTWWFRLLVVVLIGWLLYMAYRFRIRQLTKVHQLRNDISRDLHDDIGSTLSSVYYSAELLRQQGQQHPELQGKIVDNISNNTRDLVERMRDIVWSIHPDQDAMPEMAARMREYINRLDLPQGMNIDFECDVNALRSVSLDMKSRRNVYLVFKEGINNAIKYSGGTMIKVTLKPEQHQLHLTIEDNGTGFDPGKSQSGNGLRTMKERMEETGGSYRIVNRNPGTTISASIPVQ